MLHSAFDFESKVFPRNGHRLAYLDEGQGEPVVMLHGNPTWSYYYRRVIHALRGTHRCLVPDHIGMGRSDKPPLGKYPYTIQSRIDDLEAWLDHLDVTGKITLIVQDWGGMIGMGYATKYPDRIKRIIATNTGCSRLPKGKPFPTSLWLGRNTGLGAWLILQHNMFCKLAAKWCVKRAPLPPEIKAMYLQPYDTPANRVAVLRFVQTIPLRPTDPEYGLVEVIESKLKLLSHVPTLLLWGMKDFVFDKHFLAEWQRHFPHATTQTWPDCGHYLLEDAPAEVIPAITTFLQAHP